MTLTTVHDRCGDGLPAPAPHAPNSPQVLFKHQLGGQNLTEKVNNGYGSCTFLDDSDGNKPYGLNAKQVMFDMRHESGVP
jgi:hypothetical protein